MAPQSDDGGLSGLAPEDAFNLLGAETRIGILQALWEAYDPYADNNSVPFSDLYDGVEIDDTGNFNYHLGKLTGHFVRQTDDGYELTGPGFRIVRAVIAGTATEDPTLAPTGVDVSCLRCHGPVEVSYEDRMTWVRCTECEGVWGHREGDILGFGLPPRGIQNRTPEEILDASIGYTIHRKEVLRHGVCPDCGGTVDTSLTVCEDHDASDGLCETCDFYFVGTITHVCNSCKQFFRAPSWDPLHHHPALIAFYHEHGVNHVPHSWDGMRRSFEWREELRSTEPPRLGVTVPYEGDELHATIDETGTVVDVTSGR